VLHKDKSIGRPVRTSGGSWERELVALGMPARLYHPLDRLQFATPGHDYRFDFAADRPVVLDVTGAYRYLAERARAAGAEIRCGQAFARIEASDEDGIVAAAETPQGPARLRARYVVDASGGWRAVLAALGVLARSPRQGLGVEYEFEDARAPNGVGSLFVGERFAPSGYGWIFPTRHGTTRVGIGVIRPDSAASPGQLLRDFLGSGLPQRLGLATGRLIESHSGAIPSDGTLERFVFGRVVAVGDSAGQALPLLGEGIRYAIEAGRRLGAALGECLGSRRHAPGSLLAYGRWWNRKYRRRFRLAQVINERISRYADEDWDAALRFLQFLSGDALSSLLHLELGAPIFAKMARRDPRLLLKIARTAARSMILLKAAPFAAPAA